MKHYCKVNIKNSTIVMDRSFYKNAFTYGTPEYNQLQIVRADYPGFTPIQRKIKTNSNKQKYDGLTYFYMEHYISIHENAEENRKQYDELRLIAQCHSKGKRYPTIKKWFLDTYPEVREFGSFDIDSPSPLSFSSDTSFVA